MSDEELLEVDGVVEETGAVPVPVAPRARGVVHGRQALPVIAQAAAVAATGFAAGALTAAAVRAARSRTAVKPRRRAMPVGPQIIATRSFIVDVHVLAPRD